MPACRPKGFAVGPDLTDPTEVLAAAFGDLASPLIAGGVLRPEPPSGRHNGEHRQARWAGQPVGLLQFVLVPGSQAGTQRGQQVSFARIWAAAGPLALEPVMSTLV